MTSFWCLLIRRFLPEIRRVEQLPPLLDPVPSPEYHQAMAQAQAARDRAERILAACSEPKPTSTRPA